MFEAEQSSGKAGMARGVQLVRPSRRQADTRLWWCLALQAQE